MGSMRSYATRRTPCAGTPHAGQLNPRFINVRSFHLAFTSSSVARDLLMLLALILRYSRRPSHTNNKRVTGTEQRTRGQQCTTSSWEAEAAMKGYKYPLWAGLLLICLAAGAAMQRNARNHYSTHGGRDLSHFGQPITIMQLSYVFVPSWMLPKACCMCSCRSHSSTESAVLCVLWHP
jgi:hypothetical protein